MATLNGHLSARRILSGDLYGGIATGTFNYNELENKPSLNGNVLQGNVTLDIPDKTSDLTNDSGYITLSDIPTIPTKTSELLNDSGFITSAAIPDKTSDLTNDSGFITSADVPTATSDLTNDSGFITSAEAPVQSVNGRTGDVTIFVPATTSQLTNDSGFITSSDIPVTSVNTLTGDVVLDGSNINYDSNTTINSKIDAVEAAIPTATSDLNNDSGFISSTDINAGYSDINNAGASVLLQDAANDTAVAYMNIEISPIQESGTPTPSNPLPITGLTDVVITVSDSESNQTTNTISLGQTVYGGTLNVTTGELTITHGMTTLDSTWNWWKGNTQPANNNCFYTTSFPSMPTTTNAISSHFEQASNTYITDMTDGQFLIGNNNGWIFVTYGTSATTTADLQNWLSNNTVTVCYELETPTTVQLTPTEIKTYATLCTININSNCDITYMRYFTEGSEIIAPQVKKILQAFNLI